REALDRRAAIAGEHLLAGLRSIRHAGIRAVRGKGLLIGMELDPGFMSAREFCERLMANGILSKDTHGTVVRFAPPLTIAAAQFDHALSTTSGLFAHLPLRRA